MNRARALFGSLLFLVLAPGTVVFLIPWWICHWQFATPFAGYLVFRIVGIVLILAGAPILLDSFRRFAVEGLGTPAPIAPTNHLIVTGWYRHVRNPMYVAVFSMIVGQALLFGSAGILLYGGVAGVITDAFVRFYEEPTLRKAYGAEYEEFCKNVRRWIPRLRPWRGI